MARTRTQKDETISRYEDGIAKAPHAFLLGFQGISVPEDTELRVKIRESGGSYEVVKNTLALRAVEGQGLEALGEKFVGPTSVAYIDDDPVALAKALRDFQKDVPAIEFKGGLVDGKPIGPDDLEQIASMPSRDDLIAKLLFLLQSPITRLARTLAAVPREFVVVLDQIAQQKGEAS